MGYLLFLLLIMYMTNLCTGYFVHSVAGGLLTNSISLLKRAISPLKGKVWCSERMVCQDYNDRRVEKAEQITVMFLLELGDELSGHRPTAVLPNPGCIPHQVSLAGVCFHFSAASRQKDALKDLKVKNYLQFKMIALVSIPTANLVRTSPLQDIQLSPFGLCSHLYLRNEPCLISVIHAAAGFPHFETYSHVEDLVARQS